MKKFIPSAFLVASMFLGGCKSGIPDAEKFNACFAEHTGIPVALSSATRGPDHMAVRVEGGPLLFIDTNNRTINESIGHGSIPYEGPHSRVMLSAASACYSLVP